MFVKLCSDPCIAFVTERSSLCPFLFLMPSNTGFKSITSSPQVEAQNSHYLSYFIFNTTNHRYIYIFIYLPVEVYADVSPHVLGTDG